MWREDEEAEWKRERERAKNGEIYFVVKKNKEVDELGRGARAKRKVEEDKEDAFKKKTKKT